MSFSELMEVPMRAFWLLSNSIPRIEAEREQRAVRVAVSSQSPEDARALIDDLEKEVGEVYTFEAGPRQVDMQRDVEGFEALRNMANLGL